MIERARVHSQVKFCFKKSPDLQNLYIAGLRDKLSINEGRIKILGIIQRFGANIRGGSFYWPRTTNELESDLSEPLDTYDFLYFFNDRTLLARNI